MDFAKWVQEFKVAHQKIAKGELGPTERERHLADRNELARAVLANQKVQLRAGQQPRQLLRSTRVLPVEVEVGGRMRPLMTLELSVEGFSALTGDAPVPDKPLQFVLRLPNVREPVAGEVTCLQSVKQTGNFRSQFKFAPSVGEVAREQVEHFVFGDLLDHLKS